MGHWRDQKTRGETDTQDVIAPARYPTGMEAEVMAVTRSQSARLKLEMVVPADGALSITGYLGSSKRIPIAPSFLRRCRQKEIGNALSVPPVTIFLPSNKCNTKKSWDFLEPPHKRNPPLYSSAAHLHLSHGMRRQTVRIRQFRFSIPNNEFRSKCIGELEKMTLPEWNRSSIFRFTLAYFTWNPPHKCENPPVPLLHSHHRFHQIGSEIGRRWQIHHGTGLVYSPAHFHISHRMCRKTDSSASPFP